MIVNPYTNKEALATYAGTRILQQDFGLIGTILTDPYRRSRLWTIQALYGPVPGRSIGGIRAKLTDNKGYISFLNQMDLEILLGLAQPGTKCRWSGKEYAGIDSKSFYGFCCDDDDLIDDLFDRELLLRGNSLSGMLTENTQLVRRIHYEDKVDFEELQMLLWDADPETGICPDLRIETLERRWSRVERQRLPWEDA